MLNAMAADALVACVTITSAALWLAMISKCVPVLQEGVFPLAASSQLLEMIENENTFWCYLK